MIKLLIPVVVYKKQLKISSSVLSLMQSIRLISNSKVLVYDNSPSSQSYQDVERFFLDQSVEFEYRHCPENRSLSKIYNESIDEALANGYEYICFLDQDSHLDEPYFIEIKDVKEKYKPMLMLPRVLYKDVLVSPTKKYLFKGFYFGRIESGFYYKKNISAINSGIVVSSEYYKMTGFRYDERLKFYGTDDYFLINYNKSNYFPYVLNYEMNHELTLSTLNTDGAALHKSYLSMIEAWRIIYSDSPIALRLLLRSYILIHRLYMFIKYKNWNYLCPKK